MSFKKNHIEFKKCDSELKEKCVFHAFATKNFLKWFPIYSKSIKNSFGDKSKIILQTLNATQLDIDLIKYYHENTDIYNCEINVTEISEITKISIDDIIQFQNEMVYGETTSENYKYKVFIAVYLRFRSILTYFQIARKTMDFKYFIHSDIDVSHRMDVTAKLEKYDFDISMFGRGYQNGLSQPLGAYIICRNNEKAKKFFEIWNNLIDSISITDWPRGFGQLTQRDALIEVQCNTNLKFLDLTDSTIGFSKLSEKNKDIWLNSNSHHPGSNFKTPYENTIEDLSKAYVRLSSLFDKN
jgi:hypothetical protein